MQPKILIQLLLIVGFSILLLNPAFAQVGMMGQFGNQESTAATEEHSESLDQVLLSILQSQETTAVNDLDCSQVTDEQFESLGEAWMSYMHPDTQVHERMDEMMARLPSRSAGSDGGQGGEGLQSLQSAHISMGQRYLGCSEGLRERGWNPSMMGMMGGWGGAGMGVFWSFWLLSVILVDILLIVLIRYFWKKAGK